MKDSNFNRSVLNLTLILVIQLYSCGNNIKEFNKMKSNPKALYHGGPDGGHFFEIIEKKDDKFRIKIYLDYNEELMIDGYFKSISDSCGGDLTLENIQEFISTYNDDKIFINGPKKNDFCKLVLVETIYDMFKK